MRRTAITAARPFDPPTSDPAGFLDQAAGTVHALAREGGCASALLRRLVAAQIKAGRIDAAALLVDAAGNDVDRTWVMMELITAWAGAGRFDAALSGARGLGDSAWYTSALRVIGLAQANADQADASRAVFDEAITVAAGITEARLRAWALRGIVTSQTEAGWFDLALRAVERIEITRERALALGVIGVARALAGQAEAASSAFEAAVAAACAIEDDEAHGATLRHLAIEQARVGRFDAALRTVEIIEAESADHALFRASALGGIAIEQARAMRLDEASDTFDRALRIAEDIEDLDRRETIIVGIAAAQIRMGWFDAARHAARGIEESSRRAAVERDIAVARAKAGGFDEALRIAQGIEEAHARAWTQRHVVMALTREGRFDEALRGVIHFEDDVDRAAVLHAVAAGLAGAGRFEEALRIAESIEEDEEDERAAALHDIALARARGDAIEGAPSSFDAAMRIARRIGEMNMRARALAGIAVAQTKAGRIDVGRSTFEEAVLAAGQIEEAHRRIWTLHDLALAQGGTGRCEEAESWISPLVEAEDRAAAWLGLAEGVMRMEMENDGMKA